ncbi:MAG: zinc-ribbon domain-containing protein [Polyangiaceae bacterium]
MLRVECESCKAPYQVDERRIPATGLKMRCPKCGHTFVVKAGSGEPVPPPDPHARPTPGSPAPQPSPAAANARKMQATMLGVGSGISKPPPATAKAPTKDAAATPTDSEVGLPAAKPVAAKPPVPAAKPPVPGAKPPVPGPRPFTGTIVSAAPAPQAGSGEESNLPAVPPKSEPALPVVAKRAPSDPNLPSLPRKNEPPSDSNLPAIRDAAGVPAAKPAAPKPPAPKPPVPNKPAAPPVAKPAAPVAPAAASFGEIDLPIAAAGRGKLTPPIGTPIDLPSVAVRDDGPIGATAKAAAAPAKAPAAAFDDFGEIDLPALGGGANLPAVAANLPSVAASLPTVADALPTVAEALPTVAEALPSVQSALPVTANVLPTAANVLPAAQGASPIPAPIDLGFVDPFASLPPAGPAPSLLRPRAAAVVPVADVPPVLPTSVSSTCCRLPRRPLARRRRLGRVRGALAAARRHRCAPLDASLHPRGGWAGHPGHRAARRGVGSRSAGSTSAFKRPVARSKPRSRSPSRRSLSPARPKKPSHRRPRSCASRAPPSPRRDRVGARSPSRRCCSSSWAAARWRSRLSARSVALRSPTW